MSREQWRRVRLGELLTEARRRVLVSADQEYPIAGVYGFGRGVLLRESVTGQDIAATHLYRIKANQVIYSRLKAFEGAFAVVPEGADGRYVSNEFPTFDVNADKTTPPFMSLLLARPVVWAGLTERITGMGARRERLQVDGFLAFEVDLPPLSEQQMIVRAVGAASAVATATRDEAEAARRVANAVYAALIDSGDTELVRLSEVLTLDVDRVAVQADDQYDIAGVKIAGQGLFWRETLAGSSTTYASLHRLRAHQVVYRKLTAWEGPITVVPPAFDGAVVSPEFPTFTVDSARLDPDFMELICRRADFHSEMKARATGTAERRNRLKPGDLLEIELALPPLDRQRQIAAAARLALALEREAEAAAATAVAIRDQMFDQSAAFDAQVAA